jgi:methionyl-tRNA formyltransferase
MTQVALKQIESFYPKLVSGNFQMKKQEATGNTWRKRSKLDGRIDFRMTTTAICNLVRALTKPFPGANCTINNIDYSVWKVDKGDYTNPNIEPGKVINRINNKIEVKTGDGSIILVEHLIPDTIELDYI